MPRIAVAQTASTDTTTTTTTTTTSAAVAPGATDSGEEPTVLSPFVVDAAEDKGSYKANSTLAGTRVRTDLKDVASAITVVTAQFLQDTGATNASDLLVYTPSTEVAGLRGNFSGVAGGAVFTENTVSATTRVRGLDSADNTRDYFLSDIPWDSFDVGRVDLQRGPNSILFGTGSPAGIINVSTNGAAFNNSFNLTNRFDEYGSLRDSATINQEIIPGVLAIRLAALEDDEKYEQASAFNNTTRYYGAFRFDPKLFGKDSHTSIRGNFEHGKQTSDNPRDIPPDDEITPWFQTGADAYGNPGLNKLTENQFSLTNRVPGVNGTTVLVPGASGGPESANYFQLGGNAQGRSYWPDVINYYEATPLSSSGTTNIPSNTPIMTITAQANTGLANGGNGIAGLTTFRPDAIPPYSAYATYVGNNGTVDGYTYPGKPIPGGVYYTDKVITDPTIFNFYKQLLDGPNKHEWKSWQAFNLAVDQTFFDDRVGFEFAYDQQKYTEGAEPFLEGYNYGINIDINQTYANGAANPNVGRPYVAQATSGGQDNNYQTTTTRQTYRFTPTAELRASDFFGNSVLSKIFGKSDFTGLYEKNTVVAFNYQFAEYATTPDYATSNSLNANAANSENSNRSYEFLAYIGPSLSNKSSASGANLGYLNYVLAPPEHQQTLNFNSTWNKPTDPTAPGYVDPTAPYSYTNYSSGAVTTNSTQAQNPANYVGWTNEQISWMSASNPADLPDMISTANRTRYTDESEGITWQAYFLDGDLVPSLGWRKDKVTNYQSNAYQDPNTGFTSLNFPDNLSSRTDVAGTSKTWGGVYHFPKALMSKLPGDMTFSVLLNRSENFKPDAARLSLDGLPIPNASGTTTEYGFVATAFADKLSLKVDWYKTLVKNASLGETNGNSIAGLGSNAYFIADGSIWGYAWATALQDGLRGNLGNGFSSTMPGSNWWDYGAGSGYAIGSPQYIATNAASAAIVNAWVNNPFSEQFFSSYSLSPALNPTIAHTTGNLKDGWLGGFPDANGPPFFGGGSNFGDHQTTVDNLSKGVEIELTAQPTRNWNLTLNYTHENATHSNIDPITQVFLSTMAGFYNGPGGQLREWYNGGPPISGQWDSSIIAPWTVQLNDQGHAAPEVAPWRLNLITTYNFDRGPIKGWFVGGALRVEAKRILGFKYDPTFKNVNATDPNYASVPGLTTGGLNVNEPFYGSNDTHLDAWLGYSRKVYRNVNWRIQLNLQSVGEKDKLVAAGYEPDGSLALARIQQGMGWRLENSFDF